MMKENGLKMNRIKDDKKRVIIKQYVALFAALFLFIPLSLLSLFIANSIKWGVLMIFPLYFYIAISSIKNKISIIRWRGQFDLSREGQAVAYGKFLVVSGFITVVIILIIPAHLFFSF